MLSTQNRIRIEKRARLQLRPAPHQTRAPRHHRSASDSSPFPLFHPLSFTFPSLRIVTSGAACHSLIHCLARPNPGSSPHFRQMPKFFAAPPHTSSTPNSVRSRSSALNRQSRRQRRQAEPIPQPSEAPWRTWLPSISTRELNGKPLPPGPLSRRAAFVDPIAALRSD